MIVQVSLSAIFTFFPSRSSEARRRPPAGTSYGLRPSEDTPRWFLAAAPDLPFKKHNFIIFFFVMTRSDNAIVNWEFRWNQAQAPEPHEIADFLKAYCRDWGFQLEKGDSGLIHYQGHFRLVKKRRDPDRLFSATFDGAEPNYLAPTAKNTLDLMVNGEAKYYSTKTDTRIDGPWTHDDAPETPMELYDCHDIGDKLTDLQKIWATELTSQNTREILFVYGKTGGVGKSTFGMYLLSTQTNTIVVPATMESAEDMLQWCYAFAKPGKDNQATIILDIPRSCTGQNSWNKFLTALEDIKRGYLYDKRYTAKFKLVYPPKIVVFSNHKPPEDLLTSDRFVFMHVDDYLSDKHYQDAVLVRKQPRVLKPWFPNTASTSSQQGNLPGATLE